MGLGMMRKAFEALQQARLRTTEQSDSRGQDVDTDLDEETAEFVGAHQNYLRAVRHISSAQVSSAQVRG